jgi:hypothetical protein
LPVGDRSPHRHALTAAAGQRSGHVVGGERLDADHPASGRDRLHDGRAARNQPAASDRHDHRVELAGLLQQFQRDRPLSRHHRHVVVRVHDGQATLAGERRQQLLTIGGVAIELDHLGPVRLGRRALQSRRVGRHQDRRPRAAQRRRDRHRLGVVARARRADALRQCLRRQR